MAIQEAEYYDSDDNIYGGKLYCETITVTAGADGLNNRSVMYSISNRMKTILDNLPDNYTFEVVSVMGQKPTGNFLYNTSGSSHTFNTKCSNFSFGSDGIIYQEYRIYNNTWGDVNARTLTITSAGATTNSNIIGNIVVQPNQSATYYVYYKLHKQLTAPPTE